MVGKEGRSKIAAPNSSFFKCYFSFLLFYFAYCKVMKIMMNTVQFAKGYLCAKNKVCFSEVLLIVFG